MNTQQSEVQTSEELKAEMAQLSADFDNIISRMKDLLDNHAYFQGLDK